MTSSVLYICGILCTLLISLTISFEINDAVLPEDDYYPEYKGLESMSEDSRKDNLLRNILKFLDSKNGQRSNLPNGYLQNIFENNLDSGTRLPIVSKRKVFWQPLGYIPASVRITGNNDKASDNAGPQLFRYG